jgi:hypothetical protein
VKRLREALDELLDDLESSPVAATTSLIERWPQVVGRELAAHSEPLGVRQGVLLVAADDPAYGSRLQWEEREVIARLAAVLGEGVVDRVQVKIRPR